MPAEKQAAWIDSLGMGPNVDELALEFDAGYLLASQWIAAGWLSRDAEEAMRDLDRALAAISGEANADLWTIEAVQSATERSAIRDLALNVLLGLR